MKVGDKVVVVNDSPCFTCGAPLDLKNGEIHVISGFVMEDGDLLFELVGKNNRCHLAVLVAYCSSRFRLLDELKQEARERQQTSVTIHVPPLDLTPVRGRMDV